MNELQIAVMLKPVPDPASYARIEIDPQTGILRREGLATVINPADKHALEEALRLKEQYSGRVTLVSMAPTQAVNTLKEGLAMGADAAVLLSDRAFAGADTLATARTLAAGLKLLGSFDLVLAGCESADGGTAHVPSQLGELLGFAHLTNVVLLNLSPEGSVTARTKIENGYLEVEGLLPMVIGVRREINAPRYTSLPGILAAQGKTVRELGLADLGLEVSFVGLAGSPTRPGKLNRPELRRKSEQITGDPSEVARGIVDIIRRAGVLG